MNKRKVDIDNEYQVESVEGTEILFDLSPSEIEENIDSLREILPVKKVDTKKTWDNTSMNVHLSHIKSFFIVTENGIVVDPARKQEFDLYYRNHVHEPLMSLCRYQVNKLNKDFLLDPDILDGVYAHTYDSLTRLWDPRKSPNSFGFLTQVMRTSVYDVARGSKRALLFSPLHCHKHPVEERVELRYASYKDRKDGILIAGEDCLLVKSQKPIYDFLEENPDSDIQSLSTENRNLDNLIDFQILSEYIPDCKGTEHHKSIAYIIIEILTELFENKSLLEANTSKKSRSKFTSFLFYEKLMEKDRSIVINKVDIEIIRMILKEAFSYYAEDFLDFSHETIYGDQGFCPSESEDWD